MNTNELKPTDLRIGNLVKIIFTGEIAKVTSVDRIGLLEYIQNNSDDEFDEFEDTLSAFEPILLTEEILIRFGAQLKSKDGHIIVYELFGLEVWFYMESWGLRKRINKDNSLFLCNVPYVHKFQNTILDLTQTELTLKDNL